MKIIMSLMALFHGDDIAAPFALYRLVQLSILLPEGPREKFTQQATGYIDKIAERIDQQRAQETQALVLVGVQAAARSPSALI